MSKQAKSIPIFLAFLCMGFADAAGPLTSQIQKEFELSNLAAGLITFSVFIMFGLLSIPLGIFQDRKSKKLVLVLGIASALAGMIIPFAGHFSSFVVLLGGLLLLGAGATFLQVAGNPIMRDVSPEGKYSRNLSFAQFVKSIGSLSGAVIPLLAVSLWSKDWKLLFPVYGVILAATLVFTIITPIHEKSDKKSTPATLGSCFKLLENPFILLMVLGIFLYVGSEVSMSAKLPNYLEHKFNFDIEKLGLWGTVFFLLTLMTGRFLGGVILNWIKPRLFLLITALISLAGIGLLYLAPEKITGFVAISLIGLGFANIFPLIFSIAVDRMPERANEISGLMVTAIIGGAIMPIPFGFLADKVNLMAGFLVPATNIAYIFLLSFLIEKRSN